MIAWGLELHTLDTYFSFSELSATPETPESGMVRIYGKDNGAGVSTLCYLNDAGTEVCLPSTGIIPTGSGGAAGAVAFWTSATNIGADIAHFFWNDTNDQLLIGIASGSHLGTDCGLLVDEDASSAIIGAAAHSATVTHGGAVNLLRSRGTHAAQTIVASGDRVSRIVSQAYDGGAYRDTASIDVEVDGTPGSGDMPGRLVFKTTPDGSTTLTERARLTQGGQFALNLTASDITFRYEQWGGNNNDANMRVRASTADTAGPGLVFQKSRGTTLAGATATLSGDFLGAIGFGGFDGSSWVFNGALIRAQAAENYAAGARGSQILFETIPLLSTTRAERFRIGPSGQWGIGGATYGSSGDIFSSGGASAPPTWVTRATLNAALDHGTLAGLADDDHTQYALLAGRSGGQTLIGGTASGDDLTLQSTSNATRGDLITDVADITMVAASRARMASQNRFRYLNTEARVYKTSGSQAISNNTFTAVTFDAEDFDTDTLHDNATNNSRITVAITGKYHITGTARWEINGTGERVNSVRKNGVATDLLVGSVRGNGTSRDRVDCSGTLSLTAGDYIELYVLQDSGGNLNVEASGQETSFEAVYAGE